MGRTSVSPPELLPSSSSTTTTAAADLAFRPLHDRSLFKRPNPLGPPPKSSYRHPLTKQPRPRRRHFIPNSLFYAVVLLVVFGFAFTSLVMQSSIISPVFRHGGAGGVRTGRERVRFGTGVRFVASGRFLEEGRLEEMRRMDRSAVRAPRLAVVLGNMKKNPESLMLFTVMKNLQHIGYVLKLYSLVDGEARMTWEDIGGQITKLNPQSLGYFDWTLFEGVIADSVEAKEVISSLMLEPFCSVPLVWIIQEDKLAKHLLHYMRMGWDDRISLWRHTFSRADVVVFPDFSLPLLHSVLDSGNFFVIPGSPLDVWAAETYAKTHSKHGLRKSNGYNTEDVLILVVGNSIIFNELSWDYAVAMHTIGPLIKYAKGKDVTGSFKFIFLCGNSTDGHNDALEDVAAHLGLSSGSIRQYSMDHDVNEVLLMVDIVLYGPSQDEQAFPPLLIRAMSFGVPVVAPDLPVIRRYIVDGVHGMIFSKHNPEGLLRIFSLLISSDGKLSKFADGIGSSGRLLARNLLAFDSITGYAKLMENVVNFPSEVLLPAPVSHIQQDSWEWDSFGELMEQTVVDLVNTGEGGNRIDESRSNYELEDDFNSFMALRDLSEDNSDISEQDLLIADLNIAEQLANIEESERREMDQIQERMDKNPGVWDELYRNARKSEKFRFEANERDEGELERMGRSICIYEVYNGAGSWPFLHHGSLYRGLSLSTRTRRLRSDDVDAVNRLPFLNESHYRDLLCEMGGMFSIAYKVDDIHRRPWIGFQSWRASARKVSLSATAERVLEETIQHQTRGDAVYFWAHLDMDSGLVGVNSSLSFWSICDVINGGHCRNTFQNAFRHMYGLPSSVEALPPMPEDHDHWSALHSWVMPTSSFLEFTMFTRMFVDALDALHHSNTSGPSTCLLGFSEIEKKHCYCRILDLVVNVWAYHSARRMVYIDPHTGLVKEQHPVELRKGLMWTKYFNLPLLKSMDEDLAEAADDGDLQREAWLWPLTGEVHWQGIYEREREQRYRIKMDKKRKLKEKLVERIKYGYKQKALG